MKCGKCDKAEADRTVTIERGTTKISLLLCAECSESIQRDMNGDETKGNYE